MRPSSRWPRRPTCSSRHRRPAVRLTCSDGLPCPGLGPPPGCAGIPPVFDGPATMMGPLCAVLTVWTQYATGPASAAITASPAAHAVRSWAATVHPGRTAPTRNTTAAAAPRTTTSQRRAGTKSGDLPSSTHAHPAVRATVTANSAVTQRLSRCCHRCIDPMPTTAATPGARATV